MPRGGPRVRTAEGHVNGVGVQIRKRLDALKLTQFQFAGQIATATQGAWNPSENEIYKLQRGTRIVSDLELRVLARVLDCSVTDLLGEDPPLASSSTE